MYGKLGTITILLVLLSRVAREIDRHRVDVISTGATLRWLVTGSFPRDQVNVNRRRSGLVCLFPVAHLAPETTMSAGPGKVCAWNDITSGVAAQNRYQRVLQGYKKSEKKYLTKRKVYAIMTPVNGEDEHNEQPAGARKKRKPTRLAGLLV